MSANNPISKFAKFETSCFFLEMGDSRYYPDPFSLSFHPCIMCIMHI